MVTTADKKKTAAAEEVKAEDKAPLVEKPLEELILNKTHGKYQVVELISFRAKWLRSQEDHRHLTQTEVLELAMREVLSGAISEEDLMKQLLAAPAALNGKKEAEKPAKKK